MFLYYFLAIHKVCLILVLLISVELVRTCVRSVIFASCQLAMHVLHQCFLQLFAAHMRGVSYENVGLSASLPITLVSHA